LGEKGNIKLMDYHYQQLAAIQPNPDLSPNQVVKIQLEGLQNNDLTRDNTGIRICFNFASPGNKIITGPIANFIKLVKTPSYNLLIGFERAEFSSMVVKGRTAQQAVRIIHTKGETAVYAFVLSKQDEDPYRDCWMTDAVIQQG
jgi:hypothetical protein